MQTQSRIIGTSSEDTSTAKDSPLERAKRFLFGDDCFVSYARHDSDYALALADELTKDDLSCFLDQWGTAAGEELPEELVERLKRSTILVIIGTKSAASSDNVKKEVVEFKKTGRPVIPITFVDQEDFARIRNNEVPENLKGTLEGASWYNEIVGIARTVESKAKLKPDEKDGKIHPSSQVVTRIVNAEGFQSRTKRLRRAFWTTLASLLTVLLAIGVVALVSIVRANQTVAKARNDQTTAELKARQADQDRITAETASQSAIEARTKAESETQKAKENLGIAQKDLKKASADLLTANQKTQQEQAKAETARREADKQQLIAGSYSLANKSSQELRLGAGFLSQSLEDALKSMQQFSALQMHPLEADTALRESLAVFPKLQLTKHFNGRLRHARFSPDGKSFVVMGEDRSVQVYRTEKTSAPIAIAAPSWENQRLGLTRGDIALSNDLRRVAYIRPDLDQSGINIQNYVEIKEIYGKRSWRIDVGPISAVGFFEDIALSPDGKYLVFALRDQRKAKVIELWDIDQNRRLAYLDPPGPEKLFAISISFSPDGKTLVIGGAVPAQKDRGRVLLWSDINWGTNPDSMQQYFDSEMQLLQTGTLGFYSISPSNDGKKFLLQYWTGGAGVWTRTDSPEGVPPSLQPMVHFPDTGFLLATVFDSIGQTVSLIKDPGRASDADAQSANWCYESWEAAGYNGPAPLPASSHIESLHFTRDGSTLFGVSKEFTSNQDPVIIQKWPANGGIDRPEEFKMEGIDILRSPSKDTDARFIVMANSVQVEVWDVERQRKMTIPSEKDLTPVFTKVTRTPNKALMAVAYRGGIGYVQFHKIIVYEYEGNSERFVKTHGPITVSNSPLQASFSADGEYIAVYFDDGAQIFDLPNQKKITSEFLSRYLDVNANQKISGISFSPKNSYIAISYERTGPEAGSLIDVWDYANNRKLTSSRSGGLIVGRFSPDANYFVIRMGDYLLKIIGLRGPQAAPKTVRLNSEIEFLAFGPRAQSLAVVDGFSVNLIDLATGLTTALLHQNDITALAFSEDESYLATNGDADNGYSSEVRRWPLKPDLLIKEASDRLELFKRGNNR